jgi:hypothetical protein
VGQLGKSGVSSNEKDEEWYMDIWGSKVVSLTSVDWGPFIVDPWSSIWLCTDHMSDLWGPINWSSSIIVVVVWYPTILLEMSIRIMYEPPTDNPACGITWKTCTSEKWNPDRPYDIITKCCHTWPVRWRAYVVWSDLYPCRVGYWFRSPQHSEIWVIACSLPLLVEIHIYYYDDY